MADLNNFSITCRLTRDAETKTVGAKGTLLTEFDVANNTGYGQYASTQFFRVNVWGQGGQAILQYLKKGKQVALSGTLENKAYEGRDGQRHDAWTITTNSVTLLADARNSSAPESVNTASDNPYNPDGSVKF